MRGVMFFIFVGQIITGKVSHHGPSKCINMNKKNVQVWICRGAVPQNLRPWHVHVVLRNSVIPCRSLKAFDRHYFILAQVAVDKVEQNVRVDLQAARIDIHQVFTPAYISHILSRKQWQAGWRRGGT